MQLPCQLSQWEEPEYPEKTHNFWRSTDQRFFKYEAMPASEAKGIFEIRKISFYFNCAFQKNNCTNYQRILMPLRHATWANNSPEKPKTIHPSKVEK